jgi:hypothetical protein
VLRAAGETETTQDIIQDGLELDEGRNCCSDIFILISATYIIKISSYLLPTFSGLSFALLIGISEGILL